MQSRGLKRRLLLQMIAIIVVARLIELPTPLLDTAFASDITVEIDFQRDIRPLLADKCYACHGPDEQTRKADLRLDTRDGVFLGRVSDKGSKQRDLIVAGEPDVSELWLRIVANDPDVRMPPASSGKTVSEKDRQLIQRWIQQGAPWREHWAYVSPKRPDLGTIPEMQWIDGSKTKCEIDKFVLSHLTSRGLQPDPPSDARTLARRFWFDLTGLPPTFSQVETFVRDYEKDADKACEIVIDTLLESPHYAERMAQFWLDLVRYADTVGFHGDQEHHITPYRDYVIQAFEENLSFDRFTREQLAGDLLPDSTVEQKIASGYNRLLQTSHEGGVQQAEYLVKYSADRVRNLGTVWLGATLGCCECHDHKYDPLSQRDFYRLSAFFADIDDVRAFKGGDASPTKREPEMEVTTKFSPQEKRRTMITESIDPRPIRILARGDWMDTSGEIVEPAVPAIFTPLSREGRANRLDLANWLTSKENPLVARVFVNRIWKLFFGRGLTKSLEDFGAQGEVPDHPELLDWLAVDFVESGWNVKHLVRQIVRTKTYRQSVPKPGQRNVDFAPKEYVELAPESTHLNSRDQDTFEQRRWRLDAEFVRDNALAVSGLLVRKVGGPSARPYQPERYYRFLNFPKRDYVADKDEGQYRRGLYMHWQRAYLHPMLKAFDAPCREEATCERPQSNTPQAALVLLNDPTFLEAARTFATRILREGGTSDADRLIWAWQASLTRSPSDQERDVMQRLLEAERSDMSADPKRARESLNVGNSIIPEDIDVVELATWTSIARAIFNLSEFMTRS